jgi:hypothetical protein
MSFGRFLVYGVYPLLVLLGSVYALVATTHHLFG